MRRCVMLIILLKIFVIITQNLQFREDQAYTRHQWALAQLFWYHCIPKTKEIVFLLHYNTSSTNWIMTKLPQNQLNFCFLICFSVSFYPTNSFIFYPRCCPTVRSFSSNSSRFQSSKTWYYLHFPLFITCLEKESAFISSFLYSIAVCTLCLGIGNNHYWKLLCQGTPCCLEKVKPV